MVCRAFGPLLESANDYVVYVRNLFDSTLYILET